MLDGFPGIGTFESQFIVKVEIGNTVTNISHDAFSNCISLTSLTIPDSVVSMVGGDAFDVCPAELFDTTTIPGVKLVDGWAIVGEVGLTGNLDLNGVRGIADSAFQYFTNLASVTIPDGVTSIGDYAFSGCSSLTSIAIPAGVTSIGYSAFSDCTGLTSITLPDSVTSIESDAFYNTSIMDSTFINKTMEQVQAMNNYSWGLPANGIIHCSDGDLTVPESGGGSGS